MQPVINTEISFNLQAFRNDVFFIVFVLKGNGGGISETVCGK